MSEFWDEMVERNERVVACGRRHDREFEDACREAEQSD